MLQSSSNRHININCSAETAWIRPSWSNCCKEPTTKGHEEEIRRDLLGPLNTSNGHYTGGHVSFGLESKFLVLTAVSLWDAVWLNGWSPHVYFSPYSMEVVVLWCGGVFLVTLISLEFKAHLTSMATTAGFGLVGLSFVFQQDNDPRHLQAV